MNDLLARLCSSPVKLVERVGFEPLDDDDAIEITLASGAILHVDIGLEHATDMPDPRSRAFTIICSKRSRLRSARVWSSGGATLSRKRSG